MKVRKIKFGKHCGEIVLDERVCPDAKKLRQWIKACRKAGYIPYEINVSEMSEKEYKKLSPSYEAYEIQSNLEQP